jgi:hypothetical protein
MPRRSHSRSNRRTRRRSGGRKVEKIHGMKHVEPDYAIGPMDMPPNSVISDYIGGFIMKLENLRDRPEARVSEDNIRIINSVIENLKNYLLVQPMVNSESYNNINKLPREERGMLRKVRTVLIGRLNFLDIMQYVRQIDSDLRRIVAEYNAQSGQIIRQTRGVTKNPLELIREFMSMVREESSRNDEQAAVKNNAIRAAQNLMLTPIVRNVGDIEYLPSTHKRTFERLRQLLRRPYRDHYQVFKMVTDDFRELLGQPTLYDADFDEDEDEILSFEPESYEAVDSDADYGGGRKRTRRNHKKTRRSHRSRRH